MDDRVSHRKSWRMEPWLGGVALVLLLAGCVLVVWPFRSALLWAIIFAYVLYPLQRRFTRWFRGSRTLAAVFVTLTVTIVVAGPVVWVGVRLAHDGRELATATREWATSVTAEPPRWLAKVPVLGDELVDRWVGFQEMRDRWIRQLDKEVKTVADPPKATPVSQEEENEALLFSEISQPENPEPGNDSTIPPEDDAMPEPSGQEKQESSQVVAVLGRLLSRTYQSLIRTGLAVGQGVAQVVISAFLAFFLLRDASGLSVRLGVVVDRLAGERGKRLIEVAGGTVRGVIFGILGTALAQGVVAWVGFWVAGVPGGVLLSVLTFFFAVLPFGPPIIWLPASFWLFANEKPGMGVFLLLWGVMAISSVDNILRPFLISQGSKMPFVLIFCGVIGGALSFGLVGVFLGPTLLAVAYRLIDEWSSEDFDRPAGTAESISGLQDP